MNGLRNILVADNFLFPDPTGSTPQSKRGISSRSKGFARTGRVFDWWKRVQRGFGQEPQGAARGTCSDWLRAQTQVLAHRRGCPAPTSGQIAERLFGTLECGVT